MYTVLDLRVDLHGGVVNRVRRSVGEPKEVIRGGVIEELVDGHCVRSVVDTDGVANLVLDVLSEISNDDTSRVRQHALKRLDDSELDERGSDTDGANEKAYEHGRVGGVRDKPCDRVSGLRL